MEQENNYNNLQIELENYVSVHVDQKNLFRKTTISFLIYQENTVQQSFVIDQEIRM